MHSRRFDYGRHLALRHKVDNPQPRAPPLKSLRDLEVRSQLCHWRGPD